MSRKAKRRPKNASRVRECSRRALNFTFVVGPPLSGGRLVTHPAQNEAHANKTLLGLGSYGTVSLAEARERAAECRKLRELEIDSYIAAALTIVRAYLAAGCPNQCPPLASFGDWSRLIRSSLVWLGYVDPVDTMESARADDPPRSNLQALVAAWLKIVGFNKPMTAGE
jgi:hypothetical protein